MRDYTPAAAASGTLAPSSHPVFCLLVAVPNNYIRPESERGADTFHKTTAGMGPRGGRADRQRRNGTGVEVGGDSSLLYGAPVGAAGPVTSMGC